MPKLKKPSATLSSEAQILRQIMDYLAARQVLAFRMNTGAVKIDKRFLRFGVPGMADILAFKQWPNQFMMSSPIWIEVKGQKGIQSDLQKSFERMVVDHGHFYVLARSVDDVVEVI
jgi:hypothetical protein